MVQSLKERLAPNRKFSQARGAAIFTGVFVIGFSSYRLLTYTPTYKGRSEIKNKNVFVTQSSKALNRTMLQNIARNEGKLILIDDNLPECEKSRSQLLKATGANPTKIDCHIVDFKSMPAVYHSTKELLATYKTLDRLIITPPVIASSIIASERRLTRDGFEENMAANYFSSYLLANEFFKNMKTGDRIIFVVDTEAAAKGREKLPSNEKGERTLELDNINWEKSFDTKTVFDRLQAYIVYMANNFADRGKSKGVDVLISDPKLIDISEAMPGFINRFLGGSYISYGVTRLIPRKSSYTANICAQLPKTEIKVWPRGANVYYGDSEHPQMAFYDGLAQKLLQEISQKWTDGRKSPVRSL